MIGIVDYGVGNIKAFCNIYKNMLSTEIIYILKTNLVVVNGV